VAGAGFIPAGGPALPQKKTRWGPGLRGVKLGEVGSPGIGVHDRRYSPSNE
jgi:hypothetical protein